MYHPGDTKIQLNRGSSQGNVTRILNAIDYLPLQHREAEDELEQLRTRKPQLEAALQQPFERREELLRLQQRVAEIQAVIEAWNKEGERKQVFDEHTDMREDEDVDLDAEEE